MIKIENLNYYYEDGNHALKDINVNTEGKNIIGIIGANGSGKSTLFLNIMGILKPKSGSIIYDGKKVKFDKKNLREYRKNVNIVFQDPEMQIFYSDVYDDIAFALRNLDYSEDEINLKVTKALKMVKAEDLIDKPIHFLSYGQKKRVAIAGILALDNKVILMDEPTSGLDPNITNQIKDIIKEISMDKKIIISSHDMDLMYEICDYIYIISKGEIIKEGRKDEVFLDTDILKEAKLNKPWLVKIHEKLNLPLFKTEEEFLNF